MDGDGDRLVLTNECRHCGDGREARNNAGGGGGRAIPDDITDGLIDVGAFGGGNGGDKIEFDDRNGIGGGGGNRY